MFLLVLLKSAVKAVGVIALCLMSFFILAFLMPTVPFPPALTPWSTGIILLLCGGLVGFFYSGRLGFIPVLIALALINTSVLVMSLKAIEAPSLSLSSFFFPPHPEGLWGKPLILQLAFSLVGGWLGRFFRKKFFPI